MAENHGNKPTGAGKNSFGLIDTAKFFQELDLKQEITFLDVASGWGAYSLAAADIIGRWPRCCMILSLIKLSSR